MTATVTDSVSGPVSPMVSARANTSHVGIHAAALVGSNKTGFVLDLFCSYTVLPVKLKPAPSIHWTFSVTGSTAIVQRLVVSDVAAQESVNVACTGTGCPFSSAHGVTGLMCGSKPCTATSKQRRRRRPHRRRDGPARGRPAWDRRPILRQRTKPNTIGGVWQFKTRAGKAPSHRAGCLQPGSHSPISAAGPRLNGHADVAQLVEHFTRNEGVPGSSPGVGLRPYLPANRAVLAAGS